MTSAEFRPAATADAQACANLFVAGSPHRSLTIVGCCGYRRFIEAQIAEERQERRYWVAAHEGRIVGAAECRRFGACWFVNQIHIGEYWRGRGLGSRLLLHVVLVGENEGCETLSLDVFTDNAASRHWYESIGLVPTSRTQYAEVRPHRAGFPRCGTLHGLQRAEADYRTFGFAMLGVTGRSRFEVGLLGARWFRLFGDPLLSDPLAVGALQRYDPGRRWLLVSGMAKGSLNHQVAAHILAVSVRMRAPLASVRRSLHASLY